MTNSYLPEGSTFSAEAVNNALAGLPEELAQGVARQLLAHAAEAAEARALQGVQLHTTYLAMLAHQNYQENVPPDLDAINLDRAVRDASEQVLHGYGLLSEENKASIPESVIDFAACFYVRREAVSGSEEDEVEDFIAHAGLTMEHMEERMAMLLLESRQFPDYQTTAEIRQDTSGPLAIAEYIPYAYLGKLAGQMRTDLTTRGYTLPELNENNVYGYDEDAEYYTIPEPTVAMLPSR